MKFSVIIPVYNDKLRLIKCLAALDRQTYDIDNYEVIVVNNNKSNQPTDIKWPERVKLVYEPVPGSYSARNTGALHAQGEILAFTDSDCLPDLNWLSSADEFFRSKNCDLIGGKIEHYKPEGGKDYLYEYDRETAFLQMKNVPRGYSVTANLFVKRTVFEEMNGFDSEMKSGGDWDFTERCVKSGYMMLYGENQLVFHPSRKDITSIFKKQYRLSCWGNINVQKKYGHSKLRILLSHMFTGSSRLFRKYNPKLIFRHRFIFHFIDLCRYIFTLFIHLGILLYLINPEKARE